MALARQGERLAVLRHGALKPHAPLLLGAVGRQCVLHFVQRVEDRVLIINARLLRPYIVRMHGLPAPRQWSTTSAACPACTRRCSMRPKSIVSPLTGHPRNHSLVARGCISVMAPAPC